MALQGGVFSDLWRAADPAGWWFKKTAAVRNGLAIPTELANQTARRRRGLAGAG
jgi:hypothetical protein